VAGACDALARLVRACLGKTAIAEHKCETGMPLVILGIQVRLDNVGAHFTLDPAKRSSWLAQIDRALKSGRLCPSDAAKLAGRLAWINHACFKKLGRTFLYPIFAHQKAKSCVIGKGTSLETALVWWRLALGQQRCEVKCWNLGRRDLCHMFVDARSTPPRLAAVLICDRRILYSDMEPSQEVMRQFKSRGDCHIMSLELLAIAFGLSTFCEQLRGRNLVVFSDNTGAEHATTKGGSKEWDHSCIAHCIWSCALQLRIGLWLERVPSKDNISDDPSREKYELLERLRAINVPARLFESFGSSQTWQVLSRSFELLGQSIDRD
jgi:hypothetical protein